jgi:hypothetical protein
LFAIFTTPVMKGSVYMFENKKVDGIHATRYIASWIKSGGKLNHGENIDDFSEWLKSLGLSEKDILDIKFIATNGKLELERSATYFLANKAIFN